MTAISIVTPVLNAGHMIAETVESVVQQTAVRSGRVRLQYIIQDGGSTDDTVKRARDVGSDLLEVRSEKDCGMYDALARGLRSVEGDIISYLNAGDLLAHGALDAVCDVMETRDVQWLCGMSAVCNEQAQITNVGLPARFRSRLISCGLYGKNLPWIQQEGIFWRRELLTLIDFGYLSGLAFAGDYYLWSRFSSQHQLMIVQALLGIFRIHRGQLSEARTKYSDEVSRFTRDPNVVDHLLAMFDNIAWRLPPRIKAMMNRNGVICFDHASQVWT